MRKLTLDVDALVVQSFATGDAGMSLGTVHGRQKGNTGLQDTDCSAVDACPSARGCSEVVECRPTEGTNCPSAALDCPMPPFLAEQVASAQSPRPMATGQG